MHGGEQFPAFGVLLSQLLGFALDLLRAPLAVLNPLLADGDAPLDGGIATMLV
jgi:hypothetical protein